MRFKSNHQFNFLKIQVLSTLKVGAEALKQNRVSMSEVDDIMDQLDEVY